MGVGDGSNGRWANLFHSGRVAFGSPGHFLTRGLFAVPNLLKPKPAVLFQEPLGWPATSPPRVALAGLLGHPVGPPRAHSLGTAFSLQTSLRLSVRGLSSPWEPLHSYLGFLTVGSWVPRRSMPRCQAPLGRTALLASHCCFSSQVHQMDESSRCETSTRAGDHLPRRRPLAPLQT